MIVQIITPTYVWRVYALYYIYFAFLFQYKNKGCVMMTYKHVLLLRYYIQQSSLQKQSHERRYTMDWSRGRPCGKFIGRREDGYIACKTRFTWQRSPAVDREKLYPLASRENVCKAATIFPYLLKKCAFHSHGPCIAIAIYPPL